MWTTAALEEVQVAALDLTSTSVTLTTSGKPTSVVYVTAAGTAGVTKVKGATISLSGNLASGANSFNVSSIKSIAIDTQLTDGVSIGESGSYTILDNGSSGTTLDFKITNVGTGTLTKGTISGGVLTKFEGLNAGGDFTFETAVSSTVVGSGDKDTFTLSNFNSFAKTDTDATFMRMKEDAMKNVQLKPAYNIQYGTDSEFVTWATVGPQPTDTTTLIPFLQEMERYTHKCYRNVVADSGYESEENYLYLETHQQRSFIKPRNYEKSKSRKWKQDIGRRENMTYLANEDAVMRLMVVSETERP